MRISRPTDRLSWGSRFEEQGRRSTVLEHRTSDLDDAPLIRLCKAASTREAEPSSEDLVRNPAQEGWRAAMNRLLVHWLPGRTRFDISSPEGGNQSVAVDRGRTGIERQAGQPVVWRAPWRTWRELDTR